MAKGIKITTSKNIFNGKELLEYKRPGIVYIPLVNYFKKDCTCLVEIGDKVLKGSVIGLREDNMALPIHSSVSGKVIGFKNKTYADGSKVKCVAIENDFKEKQLNFIGAKQILSNYSKEEFVELLKDCAVTGMSGNDFPTYIKYQGVLKTIIVNAVECEPFITSDAAIINLHADEILETIDAIMEINGINKCFIAIKEGNNQLKTKFKQFLGTYPKISIVIVKDIYPMGWERMLIKQVLGIKYNKIPGEKNIVVNNVSTIYSIHKALKYKHPISHRIVTVTGDGIKKPKNIVIKIGTSMKEVIDSVGGYKKNNAIRFIVGGPMMGKCIDTDDVIITKNVTGILIMANKTEEKISCVRCGRCTKICPVGLCPVLIKDRVKNIVPFSYLHPDKCIECGLCSYICPSKIDVRESVIEAKKIMREANK